MTDESSSPLWLDAYLRPVESRISARAVDGGHALDGAIAAALSGGKRVRAVLALLWCEAVAGDYIPAVPVATAYEFAHAAALVQDDILDGSAFRRGGESIVKRYGLRSAILASNVLLAYVPREIAEYGEAGPEGGKTLRRLFELLGDSYAASVLGESIDLEMAEKGGADERDYEYMIRLKTGALIGASSASGALVGGNGGGELVEKAYSFGESLGMAYQVHDDVLDIVGSENVLGKPVFADITGGKKNIVIIHTLRHCSDRERDFLAGLPGRARLDSAEVSKAKDLFTGCGSIDFARRAASKYVDDALKSLDALESGDVRDKLLQLSTYLTSRKY
jgi:geranylgeranyl pyrophosphate synthase